MKSSKQSDKGQPKRGKQDGGPSSLERKKYGRNMSRVMTQRSSKSSRGQ